MKLERSRLLLAGLSIVALLCTASPALSDVNVTVDPGLPWVGFMNVWDVPQNSGPGAYPPDLGPYQFGGSWGTADLVATFSGPVLSLSPNTINDANPYWYTPSGGPGAWGNKIMGANMYVEPVGSYPGQTVTFSGTVLDDTLLSSVDGRGNGWTSVAFIKDFAPDYSSFNVATVPMVDGAFSVSLATVNDPTRHVQFGFETLGPCVWATDVGPYGSIQVVPEPASLVLVLGGLALVLRRR